MPNSPSKFFASLTQDQKELVMQDAAEEVALLFNWYVEAVVEATAMRDLEGEDLLNAFRQRAPEIWAAIQSFDGKEYEKQMSNWRRLEQNDLRRASGASALSSRRYVRDSAAMAPAPSMDGLI